MRCHCLEIQNRVVAGGSRENPEVPGGARDPEIPGGAHDPMRDAVSYTHLRAHET